ncbi:MAG: Uma2 family endonuclease [Thiohalocapsa sp.]|uniref:Uma2 family endonuclease n=1 Tax=Thiohalocapsa sp. TaxID=2497641 RepID=UPI0025D01C41|nr:Uma2 family endonuclease [Thiohalocapsa sp.]MCG6942455.1 Uma2 family endonuclease [Thiohalocapsa sp.]
MSATAEDLYHRYRFSVEEYLRMGEAGILTEDDRVELIDGEIIDMPPIGIPHSGAVNRVANLFSRLLGDQVILSVQNPIRIGDFSLPQPDIALLRPRDDFYASAYPVPNDILLLVEVAESSVRYDREKKLPLYAAAGVQESWLVDIPAGKLSMYREPSAEGYQTVAEANDLSQVTVAALPGYRIDLGGLFRC